MPKISSFAPDKFSEKIGKFDHHKEAEASSCVVVWGCGIGKTPFPVACRQNSRSLRDCTLSHPISHLSHTPKPRRADRTRNPYRQVEETESLENALRATRSRLSVEEEKHRVSIVRLVQSIVDQWVRSTKKNMKNGSLRVLPFGSLALGVSSPCSDIDIVCAAPASVTPSAFFSGMGAVLASDARVSRLLVLDKASVPLIKFRLKSVDVDLVFASVPLQVLPQEWEPIRHNFQALDLDRPSRLAMNGCALAHLVLAAVPRRHVFRTCLCAVKRWAKRCGIYSNSGGFLGGVSWAIMVARVCQLLPNAPSSRILRAFFEIYAEWDFSAAPILLNDNIRVTGLSLGLSLKSSVSQPSMSSSMSSLSSSSMEPIRVLTPLDLNANTAFAVSHNSRLVLKAALTRARAICRSRRAAELWQKLLHPTGFCSRFSHYIEVQIWSNSAEKQRRWGSLVASKLRHLDISLSRCEALSLCHVNPNAVTARTATREHTHADKSKQVRHDDTSKTVRLSGFTDFYFVGLRFAQGVSGKVISAVLSLTPFALFLTFVFIPKHTQVVDLRPYFNSFRRLMLSLFSEGNSEAETLDNTIDMKFRTFNRGSLPPYASRLSDTGVNDRKVVDKGVKLTK